MQFWIGLGLKLRLALWFGGGEILWQTQKSNTKIESEYDSNGRPPHSVSLPWYTALSFWALNTADYVGQVYPNRAI